MCLCCVETFTPLTIKNLQSLWPLLLFRALKSRVYPINYIWTPYTETIHDMKWITRYIQLYRNHFIRKSTSSPTLYLAFPFPISWNKLSPSFTLPKISWQSKYLHFSSILITIIQYIPIAFSREHNKEWDNRRQI